MNLTPPFEVFTLVCAYLAANAYPKYQSKYKNEQLDEGLENSYQEGRLYGMTVFYALSLLMFFICMFNRKSEDLVWIFYLAATAAEYFAKYKFIKAGKNIRRAIFCSIWALLCVIIYIARTMGWLN